MSITRTVPVQSKADTPERHTQRRQRVVRQRPDLANKDIKVIPVIEVTADLLVVVIYRHYWMVFEGTVYKGVFWPNRNAFEDAVPTV